VAEERFQAKYRTLEQIRAGGAIGNLQDGPVIETHGLWTRLVAWPGNGYQTEAIHVLTVHPGEESGAYAYTMAEEALLCLAGQGEVHLRGNWRSMAAGDLAYVPEGVVHAVRNPATNSADLVLVTQITPPQFDLYEAAGFYQRGQGTLNRTAIFKATLNAGRGELPGSEMAYRETDADCRAENLPMADVRHEGALFNVYTGTPFTNLGIPARLIVWPGAGSRTAGFNFALAPAGATDAMHIHPVSDECLVLWEGECEGYTADGYSGSEFVALETYDVILAPCGVLHGHRSHPDTPSVLGGFASPPQLDLLIGGGYYEDGVFSQAVYERMETTAVAGLDALRCPREGGGLALHGDERGAPRSPKEAAAIIDKAPTL
jgi:quercetin dioxygenase-like cupin family protein